MYLTTNNSATVANSAQARILVWSCKLLCLVLLSGLPQSARAQSTTDEYQVKAAFLFHFAQLLNWPADALSVGDSTVSLCIFDDEPRGKEIKGIIEGKRIGTRVLHVRQISQLLEIQGCNILFLGRDELGRQSTVLTSLRSMPILTVGETSNFLSDGGMIRFHLEEGRIRFDINLAAADSSRLQISSRLLLLASSVTQSSVGNRGR